MKVLLAAVLFVSALSSGAFATEKICYGSTKDDSTKGQVLTMNVGDENVVLAGDFYTGTYPALAGVVEAHSGKTYLQYKGEDGDQPDDILVDKELMKAGTTGLLQIRNRGEGFSNSVFVCHDAN